MQTGCFKIHQLKLKYTTNHMKHLLIITSFVFASFGLNAQYDVNIL